MSSRKGDATGDLLSKHIARFPNPTKLKAQNIHNDAPITRQVVLVVPSDSDDFDPLD
jgi:hypothetical protein